MQVSRKGQVTAEYLLLLSVVIVLLGVSIYSLTKIREAEEHVFLTGKAQAAANDVAGIASEVCALGDGNSRSFSLDGVLLECAGNTLYSEAGGEKVSAPVPHCELQCAAKEYWEITVKNSRGTVLIE